MSDTFGLQAPPLKDHSLTLRRLSVDDAQDVFAYASDPDVARYTLWPPHTSEEFTRGFLRMFTAPACLSWAIVPHEGGRVVGMVFLHSLNRHHARAEISFNVARNHWGQGIATRASRLVLGFSFTRLGLHRIEATCMPANVGSRRVLEKLGMTHEGRSRRSHRRYDGYHDMELFSILLDEFKAPPAP
jgi:ribosomal-protein-alanine N-acetyltransferase